VSAIAKKSRKRITLFMKFVKAKVIQSAERPL
jgi:hypothetical protein